MAKLNWDRVNIENLDALRKAQGFDASGRTSNRVATSSNGQELHVTQPPSVTCPLCAQEIKPGELRRHKKAKHSHQSWPTKIVRPAKAKKAKSTQKTEQQYSEKNPISEVRTCIYCGITGHITKKHNYRLERNEVLHNSIAHSVYLSGQAVLYFSCIEC